MTNREKALSALDAQHISYRLVEHPAVYTIKEMQALGWPEEQMRCVCKNLFLRNANGKQHFLVVLREDKRADLKALRSELGSTALSFASEERLMNCLGLTKGAVTPLGILNDDAFAVTVAFDRDLVGAPCLGVHPCDNTASVFLSYEDLKAVIERHGNRLLTVNIS